jgi:DNA-binding HxlR family transcriptional regulator
MTQGSYKQFCPVAMAAETLCNRWTILVLRELVCGSTRFNDLRRGLPRMSPGLLSKRLQDLEEAGVVQRVPGAKGFAEYQLTRAGRELEPIIMALGTWGQRWVEAEPTLANLDADVLMWDMRRCLNTEPMPSRRAVIELMFPEQPSKHRRYWLVVEPGGAIDVCFVDPGFDVDLFVSVDLRTMTAIWLGLDTVARAMERGALLLTGDPELAASTQTWLGLSGFANGRKMVTAA